MKQTDIDIATEVQKLHVKLEKELHLSGDSHNIDFLISALTEHNPFYSTDDIIDWLKSQKREDSFHVEEIPLVEMRKWYFDPFTGDLAHASGGYFAIRGLEVFTNIGPRQKWTQPIIDQPKIGLLGILTKKIDGILYFLMQAKAEPGNVNTYQIAPTVQATRSNYMRVHQGKPTKFLEYFLDGKKTAVLFDQLQSEQGARFYRKRNRNIIIRIPENEEIEPGSNFRWMTLGQLKHLMRYANTINMDARSVIANISYSPEMRTSLEPIDHLELRNALESSRLIDSPLSDLQLKTIVSECTCASPLHTMEELMRQVCHDKFGCELETRLIPLNEVKDWLRTPVRILHEDGLYFSVIGVRCEAANREVLSWDQPIIKQQDPGIVGLIMKEFEGILHFLIQLKLESGNIDLLEMAPTVQCITGSYQAANLPPYVDEMLKPQNCKVVLDTMQSEEGGRFFREENRNLLLLADQRFPLELPERFLWISLRQLKQLLMFNNFLNVETRSLLAQL